MAKNYVHFYQPRSKAEHPEVSGGFVYNLVLWTLDNLNLQLSSAINNMIIRFIVSSICNGRSPSVPFTVH